MAEFMPMAGLELSGRLRRPRIPLGDTSNIRQNILEREIESHLHPHRAAWRRPPGKLSSRPSIVNTGHRSIAITPGGLAVFIWFARNLRNRNPFAFARIKKVNTKTAASCLLGESPVFVLFLGFRRTGVSGGGWKYGGKWKNPAQRKGPGILSRALILFWLPEQDSNLQPSG